MKKTTPALSLMMFLQYFIWGAWFVTLGNYLTKIGFQGIDIGRAYSTMAWGSIIAAFFVSLVADRYFSAERLTGALHLLGAALLYTVAQIREPGLFFWVLLAYMMAYMPTVALTTTIALRHTQVPEKQFPRIRVLGTLGWIAAGITISLLQIESGPQPMFISAGLSVLLGFYCFFLPHTPPAAAGKTLGVRDVLGLDALRLLKDRSMAVFVFAALVISIPFAMYHQFVNMSMNEAGIANVAGIMTLGQMSEVVFMVAMPFFFVRFGIKKMALIGMAMWCLRYLLFALGNSAGLVIPFYVGIMLHGVAYDFFYVTVQIYVDRKAPVELRAGMQGFVTLVTYGAGWLIGTLLSGWLLQQHQILGPDLRVVGHDWISIMIVPAGIALVVAMVFLALFNGRLEPVTAAGGDHSGDALAATKTSP